MSAHHPERKELAERDLEFYAQGMWDLFCALGGDNHCKHYDPLTFMDGKALSYVLHLRDGGRSHEVYDLEDMRFDILEEFIEMFGDEFGVGYR